MINIVKPRYQRGDEELCVARTLSTFQFKHLSKKPTVFLTRRDYIHNTQQGYRQHGLSERTIPKISSDVVQRNMEFDIGKNKTQIEPTISRIGKWRIEERKAKEAVEQLHPSLI